MLKVTSEYQSYGKNTKNEMLDTFRSHEGLCHSIKRELFKSYGTRDSLKEKKKKNMTIDKIGKYGRNHKYTKQK
jgi:hypothetical protein